MDYYFVLLEDDIPVGVARADRAAAVYTWKFAAPRREIFKVVEVR